MVTLDEVRWGSHHYRAATSRLLHFGWSLSGVGDWAVGLRSPGGLLAARVCPFDPAHAAFLELCRRCPGNSYLPRVALAVALDGGGLLTVMEFLTPVGEVRAEQMINQWRTSDGDKEFVALRRAAIEVDATYRTLIRWWDGIDLNEGNVRQSVPSRIKLIDIFCMDGAALYGQVEKDAAVVREQFSPAQSDGLLDIPYLIRQKTTDELRTLRVAWDH